MKSVTKVPRFGRRAFTLIELAENANRAAGRQTIEAFVCPCSPIRRDSTQLAASTYWGTGGKFDGNPLSLWGAIPATCNTSPGSSG